MNIDKHKTAIALSALWVLASIPISQNLYNEVLGGGLFMRSFALLVVVSPVWLVYGWRWVTDESPILLKHWIGVLIGAVILFVILANDSYSWFHIAYIPIVAATAFLILVWTLYRESMFKRTQSAVSKATSAQPPIHPDKLARLKVLNDSASPLLELTGDIATRLADHLKALDKPSPAPGVISPDIDAFVAAYGLIHAAYMSAIKANYNTRAIALWGMFKSRIVSTLCILYINMMSATTGLKPTTMKDVQHEQFRGPVRKLLEIAERNSASVEANLGANQKNPFLPLYENLKPYISPATTQDQLSNSFERQYAELFGRAKTGVIDIIQAA